MTRPRKLLLVLTLVLALLLATLYGLFQVSKARSFQFFGELVDRVETSQKVLALTFDDAPTEFTDEVLRVLDEKGVPATFYVIGSNIEDHPDIAKSIVEAGHELGNHSYSHQRMVFNNETPGFVRNEIDRTNELIGETGYTGPITFRPPFGKKLFVLPWYLSHQEMTTVMWDVEPDTFHEGDAKAIESYVVKNTRPGSIVLLHPFCETTCAADRDALPHIIDTLRADGYRFVTASELLNLQR